MRYAIMHNATPPGQVSMRLRFDVGSLMERDDQQGLAHFLEHMAFNGSTNVPTRGEMVKDLERLGLAFGADTNAQTGFDSTVYKFDLPKSDDQTVDTSLMLLREIAGNLTLDQGAMDQERGVILSEERLRDTPGYRITKQRFGFMMAGQRPPERFPIGLVPVIQNAKVDLIADIYRQLLPARAGDAGRGRRRRSGRDGGQDQGPLRRLEGQGPGRRRPGPRQGRRARAGLPAGGRARRADRRRARLGDAAGPLARQPRPSAGARSSSSWAWRC